MVRTIMRVYSGLLLGLLVLLLAGCGGEALRRCEDNVANLEDHNRDCRELLEQSQDENEQMQEDLHQAQAENQDLQAILAKSQTENQQLQDDLASSQDENRQLQDTLAQAQDENEQLQRALAEARAEIEEVRTGLGEAEPDLDLVRERLWILFHDRSPAVWACDDTASRVVPVVEMPSATPTDLVAAINARFVELNPRYESPGLALEGIEGDTAAVSLARAEVVTEQMGSTGAQCYLAGVTFSLTSVEGIDTVKFEFKEGSHGAPGRYDRADYVYFLPLEADLP